MNLWSRLKCLWEESYSYEEREERLGKLETRLLESPEHAALLSEIGSTEADLLEVLARAGRGVPEMRRIERAMKNLDLLRWALIRLRDSHWDNATAVTFRLWIRNGERPPSAS